MDGAGPEVGPFVIAKACFYVIVVKPILFSLDTILDSTFSATLPPPVTMMSFHLT